mgnify:CR=1 FL=1
MLPRIAGKLRRIIFRVNGFYPRIYSQNDWEIHLALWKRRKAIPVRLTSTESIHSVRFDCRWHSPDPGAIRDTEPSRRPLRREGLRPTEICMSMPPDPQNRSLARNSLAPATSRRFQSLAPRDVCTLIGWLRGGVSLTVVESLPRYGLVGNARFAERARDWYRLFWMWSAFRSHPTHDRAYQALGRDGYWRRIARCKALLNRLTSD